MTADPEYAYHLLRAALDLFKKPPGQLDPVQAAHARRQADKSFEIESLVLSSSEAVDVAIPDSQLAAAVAEIADRYASREDFLRDLEANDLDADTLRGALLRELIFDAVMQKIGARHARVGDLDVRLYYEMNKERFTIPEKREARHILITVNMDYPENAPEAARARIEAIREKLAGRTGRFASLARQHSECPSALEGGKLGRVGPGQLYPELDAALFTLAEGALSGVIESEVGLHLLWCEKIGPGQRVGLSKVWDRIYQLLTERRRRNCQKAWIAGLRSSPPARRRA